MITISEQLITHILFIGIIGFAPMSIILLHYKKKYIRTQISKLASGELKLTPDKLIQLRGTKLAGHGNKLYARQFNFTGVYILHNTTRDKYFIGSSMTVLDQAIKHFRGSGNGAVYQDYRQGDSFLISMLALSESEYQSIDDMRKSLIKHYKAYPSGYNTTSAR